MKKIFISASLLIMMILFVGCSSETNQESSNITLENLIEAFENEGVEVDREEKPLFLMVEASDGVIFYMDEKKVAIYEYESPKALEDAKSNNDLVKAWPSKGNFVIETSNEKALEIFNSVE